MHREPFTPELSVVIPVYNEQAGLARYFLGFTQLTH
jgi:hypothetical protein